ncbi:MAG: phosphodiester glycosidase family protein [Acidimicrobiales bacterium]|nr:phosphodiester glycosidase family protein [Acidimicrobiales bacterium]MBO0893603.1 phosphodiester glycosidase family protein [Acidimicrobiales bacterium]
MTARVRATLGRHKVRTTLVAIVLVMAPVWFSLGTALTNPALGDGMSARLAEWVRSHGGASVVNWSENLWYSHHPPPVGGRPAKSAIPSLARQHPTTTTTAPSAKVADHLTPPQPISPIASPPLQGEGQWRPVGRPVAGLPAVYETFLRPDTVHTSVVVGVAWMDTKLLSATLYSGSTIPGGGPWPNTAPVSPQASQTLVAAFNAGFLLSNSNGGYYTDGKMVAPMRQGAASFVIYRNGTATIGQWGRDVSMTSDVASVRQNLDLLVDGGKPVAGLNAGDTTQWGFTLGNQVYVWRSGVGVTADGALVYVGGPYLNITGLADLLARTGAVRAMELDINTDWVDFATYSPTPVTGAAAAANGTNLLPQMVGTPGRYFAPWWSRDFFTMSARAGLSP